MGYLNIFLLAILGFQPASGVHYSQREAFPGKLTPAIAKIKETMNRKLSELRIGRIHYDANTTTTPLPIANPGDGDDILGDVQNYIASLLYN